MEQDCLPFRSTLVYPVFCGIRVTWSLVLYACFVDRCLFLCTFSFGHCVVCSFSIYDSDYSFGIFKLFPETDIINMLGFLIDNMLCLMDMYSTDSQHFDEYQMCFPSGWLVPLFVWGRLHTGVSYEKPKEVNPILLFHCLHYILCPLNK